MNKRRWFLLLATAISITSSAATSMATVSIVTATATILTTISITTATTCIRNGS
ncbi:hypothetical protein QP580_08455 [Prevotella bivia]|uniref:hypothetical protein n=1 Tax=Prevotella TaxID=838 RepID=UPI00254EE3C4|nr:hypothetical protein [Prevotella bivia]MDK7763463.1 hypothetical protein [Prevotella bivia]